MSALVTDPIIPVGAVLALTFALAALTVLVYLRLGATLSRAQSTTLLLLRLLGVVLVALLLLQPSRVERIPPPLRNRVTLVGVDSSRSMMQRDVEQGTRAEAARDLLLEAEIVLPGGEPTGADLRLFKFSDLAVPVPSATEIGADGATTRIHTSVSNMLAAVGANEGARALVLLSDGHDFELVNPARTAFGARAKRVPIFAVPIGRAGKVRDVSMRITSYQPYCYVKQKARLSAALRLIGAELENIEVHLLRDGQVVQKQTVRSGDEPEVPVHFEVVEPEVGQIEYEIQARPLAGEVDETNNHALTYLNVVDQQIQVLFLEGEPYWDTTFLQRSLMRNDKMNVDSIVQYAPGKARSVRKQPGQRELRIPATAEEWRHYDVVILGRSVEKLMNAASLQQLELFAKEHGGAVIFSRGRAFGGDLANNDLEPVVWSEAATEHVRLKVAREGQSAAPFRLLSEQTRIGDGPPELIAGRSVVEKKPLAATLASAESAGGGEPLAGMVHRRFGAGQVLSVGVDGLWRWAFNAKIEGVNTLFDRFWDQMILWLMADRDFLPTQQFSLRASSANIPLGEKIYFRALMREAGASAANTPLVITKDGKEVGRTTLTAADPGTPDKLAAEFLPAAVGKFEASALFPDGSKQIARFIVFDENVEQTDVATDVGFLRRLCESSGGRLLKPDELGPLLKQLSSDTAEGAPETRLVSAWDRVWIFWTIGLLFGLDWFLRRRWGLS